MQKETKPRVLDDKREETELDVWKGTSIRITFHEISDKKDEKDRQGPRTVCTIVCSMD